MKTYEVLLEIRAECESDAKELLEDYTGENTDLKIHSILEVKGSDSTIVEKAIKKKLFGVKT